MIKCNKLNQFILFNLQLFFVEPLIRDVTKPEDLYEGNQSIYNNLIFNISTSNLVNTDTSFTQNYHNTGRYIVLRLYIYSK